MSKCVTTIDGPVNGPKNIDAYDTQSPTNLEAYDTQSPTNLTALSSPAFGPELLTYKITMTDFPTFADLNNAYYFNSRTSSLAGPFNSDITTITSRDSTAELYGINSRKDIVKTDMLALNDTNFAKVDHVINVDESFSVSRTKGVIGNEKGAFLYRMRYLSEPFSEPVQGGGEVHNPMYFKDCTLAIAETHWMHLGAEATQKDVYRVDLNFHKNSFGYIWVYVQNDSGQTSGQYKGAIEETVKAFTNLRGRRFRIKMFVATHKDYPWALREMALGYNLGKSF